MKKNLFLLFIFSLLAIGFVNAEYAFEISSLDNAHAGTLAGSTYGDTIGYFINLDKDIIPDGTDDFWLSSTGNAHAANSPGAFYLTGIDLGERYRNCALQTSKSCPANYECIIELSSSSNAHVSGCGENNYNWFCCESDFCGDGICDSSKGETVALCSDDCTTCSSSVDCPDDTDACTVKACNAGACEQAPGNNGDICPGGRCSSGSCVSCTVPTVSSDCTDSAYTPGTNDGEPYCYTNSNNIGHIYQNFWANPTCAAGGICNYESNPQVTVNCGADSESAVVWSCKDANTKINTTTYTKKGCSTTTNDCTSTIITSTKEVSCKSDEVCNAGACETANALYWTDLSGQKITQTEMGDTVIAFYNNGASFSSGNFTIWEKDDGFSTGDGIDIFDNQATELIGIIDGTNIIAYWTTNKIELDASIDDEDYKDFFFEFETVNNFEAIDRLEILTTTSDDPLTITDISPPCGENITLDDEIPITFNVSDNDDLVEGKVYVNEIEVYSFSESVGRIHSFDHLFNKSGISQITIYVNNTKGKEAQEDINIIVVNESRNGDYIAACIASPTNLYVTEESSIKFDATTTKAIRYDTSTEYSNIPFSDLIFRWTFNDGSRHPIQDGTNSRAYNFTKTIRTFGTNPVTLNVDLRY